MWKRQNKREDAEIDLMRLFRAVMKQLWLIVIVAVLFGVVTFIYSSMFITPTYRTSFIAYVNSHVTSDDQGSISTGELNASIGLTYLYEGIISSRSVLTQAAADCNMKVSYSELKGMVKTSVSEKAALITVYVTDTDPARATALASSIAKAAPEHVARVVDGSSMRIVDEPVQPKAQYAPNNIKNTILGILIGGFLSVALVVVLELTNDLVQDAEDLESNYPFAVIGNIPDILMAEKNKESYSYRRTGEDRR